MVEDTIYPVSHGDIIITRPYENHHCIYHSEAAHKHFWILFSPWGNEKYLELFFKREIGQGNLIVPTEDEKIKITELCKMILDTKLNGLEAYFNVVRLLFLLKNSRQKFEAEDCLPEEITSTIAYINKNLSSPISVKQLSAQNHMSVNTFERHFKKYVGMTPMQYVIQRRIANGERLLRQGSTVSAASENSGFSDVSSFITCFKKQFGMTPLKYRNYHN